MAEMGGARRHILNTMRVPMGLDNAGSDLVTFIVS